MGTLSGKWHYREQFDYGSVEGEMELVQNGEKVTGTARMTETEEDETLRVQLKVEGTQLGNNFDLKATHFEILSGPHNQGYNLDTWHGSLNSQGLWVGHTQDAEHVCGIFTMQRIKD